MFSFKNIFTKLYFRGLKEVLGMRKQHLLQSNPSGGMTEGAGTVSSKEQFKKQEKLKNDKQGYSTPGHVPQRQGKRGKGKGRPREPVGKRGEQQWRWKRSKWGQSTCRHCFVS